MRMETKRVGLLRLAGWCFILMTGMAGAAEPEKAPDDAAPRVEVIRAEFGVFDASDPKAPVFTPSRVVPHRVDQRYGWMIELRTPQRVVSVREEYLIPNPKSKALPAGSDDVSESLHIETPRHNQISQRQLVPVDGRIYGEWAVGSSEPKGHRHLQVIIENAVAADFEFDVD